MLRPRLRTARRRALALAVAVVLPCAACRPSSDAEPAPSPIPVRCVPATRVAVDEVLELRGRTATPPGGDLAVASQVAGRVVETRVKEGDRVTKGAVIAIVDDLAPRAAAKQADAVLARARSADVAAQSALDRTRTLVAQGLASKRDLEDATARADAARAEVEADVAALRLASGTLGRIDVRTTFDGVVTKVWRGVGALVDGTATTPIVELAATGAVELVADVTENELALVREGQSAEVTLPSEQATIAGVVLARSRAIDPATGLGAIRIQLAPRGDPPVLGAFGRARVALGRRDGVLAIPPSALRGAVADGAEIAVCDGDKASIRAIEVGYRDALHVEVTAGLKEGERVAIDHVLGLEDGTRIVASDAPASPAPSNPAAPVASGAPPKAARAGGDAER